MNQISGNNIDPMSMVIRSQFILQKTGPGVVDIVLQENISNNNVIPNVAPPAFNFDLRNFPSGSINPTILFPSAATERVGLNGTQIFP